jgi:hypothetical protein
VTADVAALLVAARKPWNCVPPGPDPANRLAVAPDPPKLQSALAAYGIANAAMVVGRIAAF